MGRVWWTEQAGFNRHLCAFPCNASRCVWLSRLPLRLKTKKKHFLCLFLNVVPWVPLTFAICLFFAPPSGKRTPFKSPGRISEMSCAKRQRISVVAIPPYTIGSVSSWAIRRACVSEMGSIWKCSNAGGGDASQENRCFFQSLEK